MQNFTSECMNQRSEEWLRMRKNYLGASDAPVVMGLSPYMTPYELWLEKLGLGEERKTTSAMQRGNDLEAKALKWFNEEKGGYYAKPDVRFHRTIPYMMASLDGCDDYKLYNGSYVVEIKCNGKEIHKNIVMSDEIPVHHYAQMQHQLEVTGFNTCYYVSFDGESGIILEVKRDEDFIQKMLKAEAEFWDCVTNLVPPTMTEKDRNRVQKDKAVDMSNDNRWEELSDRYAYLKLEVDHYQERLEKTKQDMITLANNRDCKGNGVRLSKIEKKGSIDYNSIPELKSIDLEQYRKPSTTYWKVENVSD